MRFWRQYINRHPLVYCTVVALFLSCSRSRTRLTPAKSTDDLILERAQEEKKQMASLKKMNDCGLKAIAGGNSARKDRKPPSLPTGKSHTMATRTDQVI